MEGTNPRNAIVKGMNERRKTMVRSITFGTSCQTKLRKSNVATKTRIKIIK